MSPFSTPAFSVPVAGFEARYEINRHGEIWDRKRQKLLVADKPNRTTGYYVVMLREATSGKQRCYNLHHLMAQAFLVQPAGAMQVDHRDHDRRNNALENLRWVTPRENSWNRDPRKKSSRFVGVCKITDDRWTTMLTVPGSPRRYHGTYRTEEAACHAINQVILAAGWELPAANAALQRSIPARLQQQLHDQRRPSRHAA